jgi:hypothetical protein
MELKGSWNNGAPLDPWMLRRTYLLEFKPDAWASSVTRITDASVSREILSIERSDKKRRDDLQVRAPPTYC